MKLTSRNPLHGAKSGDAVAGWRLVRVAPERDRYRRAVVELVCAGCGGAPRTALASGWRHGAISNAGHRCEAQAKAAGLEPIPVRPGSRGQPPLVQAGQRFGDRVVVRLVPGPGAAEGKIGAGGRWLVRCSAGHEAQVGSTALLRGRQCLACLSREHVPEGCTAGVCRWCERTSPMATLLECEACNRAAHRNGREPDGRPIRVGQAEGMRRKRLLEITNPQRRN